MKLSKPKKITLVLLFIMLIGVFWFIYKTDKQADNRVVNEDEAIRIVRDLPEVKAWLDLFSSKNINPSTGGRAYVIFDHKDQNNYVIQVFESVPDNDGGGHSATFNWYTVNADTGEAMSIF